MNVKLEKSADGVILSVKVIPGSSRTTLVGTIGEMLKIKVAAPPEKGKANQCLVHYLSRLFGIRKNQVTILAGAASPVKQLRIEGINLQNIEKILEKTDG